jgi:hypothetical protein
MWVEKSARRSFFGLTSGKYVKKPNTSARQEFPHNTGNTPFNQPKIAFS